MKARAVFAAAAFAVCATYSMGALSQARPEVIVKQRQSVMTLQGKYFYQLLPMAQGRAPYDANTVVRYAQFLDTLDKMPWDSFPVSTKDVKNTAALPAIFTDTAKFKEAQDRLQSEVGKLVAVSKGGDEAAVKAQILSVNSACNNCHQNFRERQQ